jgi:hypothetical protein
MEHTGTLVKMHSFYDEPVRYQIVFGAESVDMNSILSSELKIEFLHEIYCINCGKKTNKSFGQGYCYPCFMSAPETSECVLRPELCEAHLGKARDMGWAQSHCLQDHFVYLALTSDVKVGVTRSTQVPTRWIDQGAWKAIKIASTPNRYLAGVIEVELKKHLTDKTNWRHMLTNNMALTIDLVEEKERILKLLPDELKQYTWAENDVTVLNYPVASYPLKVNSYNLDKQDIIQCKLNGIRGQYLIFEGGYVLNVRTHSGYKVRLTY